MVNNEIEFIHTIRRHLKRKGFSLEFARDGEEACCIIQNSYLEGRSEPFDLVITDVALPSMNGIDLLKWIKKRHPDISVILLSGFGDLDMILENFRPGIDAYRQKPIQPQEMLSLIQQVGQHRKQIHIK